MGQVLSSKEVENTKKNKATTLTLSKEKIFILASVLFTFLFRFFLIPQNTVINGDGIYYATLGKKMISGDICGGISAYWSPLYSLLVGISSLFFRDLEFAGRMVSVIAGTLLIVPAHFLIRTFYGRLPAYFGTILLIVHPYLVKSTGWVMTESLYTLIFTSGILSSWYALRDGKTRNFFLTGILFGLAYLTKPEAIGFLFVLFILTIGAKFFHRKIGLRRYAAGYLFILLGFTLFFLPYIIFLHQKTGQWTVSQKIMINLPLIDYEGNLLKLIGDGGQITMKDRIWGDDYQTEIRQTVKPAAAQEISDGKSVASTVTILGTKAVRFVKKQIRDYIPALLPFFFILLVIIGFFYKPWTRYRAARELFLLSFFIFTLIGYALSAIELRYLVPVIPLLIGWVAHGIIEFSNWTAKSVSNILRANRKINPQVVQIFILIILVISLTPLLLAYFKPDSLPDMAFEEKEAGLWIKNQKDAPTPTVVMSAHATPAFYADARHLFIPDENFSTIVEYARRKNVNYLVYNQRRIKQMEEYSLPDIQNLPAGLKLVYKNEQNENYEIFVYQLVY